MRYYGAICVMALTLLIAVLIIPAIAQEKQGLTAPAETLNQDELAIYGEVQSVKSASSSLSVQYYDYDTDEEKTIEIVTNQQTKIENVDSLAKVAKGDWVDVTYTVLDGKNVAKLMSVEKEEPVDTTGGAVSQEGAPAANPVEEAGY